MRKQKWSKNVRLFRYYRTKVGRDWLDYISYTNQKYEKCVTIHILTMCAIYKCKVDDTYAIHAIHIQRILYIYYNVCYTLYV